MASGWQYVNKTSFEDYNYKHLRRMLQILWDINGVMPSDRFDIDLRFKRDCYAIADHIRRYSVSSIDAAHDKARNEYKKRGRPEGAKNLRTIYGEQKQREQIEDLPSDDDIQLEAQDSVQQEQTPQQVAHIDLSAYVTHNQLNAKEYVTISQIESINSKFGEAIKTYVELTIKTLDLKTPRQIEIKRLNGTVANVGVQHHAFEDLLIMVQAALNDGDRLNVWLHGPAGTGKTTAAKMLARALGMRHVGGDDADKFYMQSALESGFQVLGYNDGHGKYVTTLFRQCWEFGGVIILDEIDSYMPSAALALNGALANGHCAFADRVVRRHPECIIIAGANTTGLGGTQEYTGRNKLDATTLDRFVFLAWGIDETLERHICRNDAWHDIVVAVRRNVVRLQFKGSLITPRASLYGAALLRAGMSVEKVMRATLRKGMTEAQWQQIAPANSLIGAAAIAITEAETQAGAVQ